MTNNWQGYTNKMLFHARLLLDAWEDADDLAKSAFREACLNAMVQAYRSLLAEIMTNYRLPVNQLPSLDEAMNSVHHKGEVSTELQYIERLEQHDSWLSALLKSHQDCAMPIQRKSVERNEIPLFNANSVRFDQSEGFLSVLESLKELVTYSRNFSLEW
ncbi:DUF6586 family protein [Endozoicomonas sp. ALB115]|uniref:DUF6586 family protein n=1 Tax=Endozoicomonas sp. ALB115 TaxID=3403074 RepID=UPI003BB5B65E